MDAFATKYDTNEKLYMDSLTEIKGIKFTFREIDVIACIIHSRGEKKIASLLLLSPRTVSAHVYNIMNKLGHNSKDQIIDFIDSSGKLPIIRTYYLHLILKANFERQLAKIKNYLNKKILYCSYIKEDVTDISSALYQSIIKHLRLANIELKESAEGESLPRVELTQITEDGYYRDMLKVTSSILPSYQMNEVIQEFEEAYKNITEIQDGVKTCDLGTKNTNTKRRILFGVIGISIILTLFI